MIEKNKQETKMTVKKKTKQMKIHKKNVTQIRQVINKRIHFHKF